MELSYNPFNEILDKVIQLLNKLVSKKLILQWQYKKMVPDRAKCELAHLYFNPKTHKVYRRKRLLNNLLCCYSFSIGWYTYSTY